MPEDNPSNSVTEKDVRALKEGDRAALRRFFVAFQPRLYHFLWLRTRSVETAEDIVQETFLRLWNNRAQLKLNTSIASYLFRIASNLAMDLSRRDDRHRELELEHLNEKAISTSSDQEMEANQLAQIIDKLVAGLPEAQQNAFLLSRFEGLSHKEIAESMSISVKTVEKHIAKALHKIRKQLDVLGISSRG